MGGGKDTRSIVNNMLAKTITDKLALEMSYSGKSGGNKFEKRPFSSTEICKKIFCECIYDNV